MEYNKLVKSLRHCNADCFCEDAPCCTRIENRDGYECVWTMHNEAADAIEELSKVADAVNDAHNEGYDVGYWAGRRDYEPKWIPVTERLPEKRKYVLVRYKNNDMAVAYWFDGDEDILFWRAMTDEGWCADCDTDPTHWMPLPEPPKEGKDERI